MVGKSDVLDRLRRNHLKVSVLALWVVENFWEVAGEPVLIVVEEQSLRAVRNHLAVGSNTDAWRAAIDQGEVLTANLLLLGHVTSACFVVKQFCFSSAFLLDLVYLQIKSSVI